MLLSNIDGNLFSISDNAMATLRLGACMSDDDVNGRVKKMEKHLVQHVTLRFEPRY